MYGVEIAKVENLKKKNEKHIFDCFDEKMLEIMLNYEYDYKKIAQNILKGEVDFYKDDISYKKYYNGLISKLRQLGVNDTKFSKIKYEKGILHIGDNKIENIDDISRVFKIFVDCLKEHGEYIKRYLQKKAALDKQLGILEDEVPNISENNTNENKENDLF